MSEGILRHSKWDALLIALSFVHGAALLASPSIPLIAVGLWWNSNTIAHNFIHLPFFRSKTLNRLYSCYLTVLLGFPQRFWRDRHLAHHTGSGGSRRIKTATLTETGLVLGLWSLLSAHSPQFFFGIYLPGYAAGLVLCYVHGYFEHAYGTKSNYGCLYNGSFFNDGYHAEHHLDPARHWTRLPEHPVEGGRTSRWPAILRWLDWFNLETLERLVLRSPALQKFVLKTHERALRRVLSKLPPVRSVTIVGGGMFPRTAILLEKLMPAAEITILDANPESLQSAREFLKGRTRLVQGFFAPTDPADADLIVVPLSFVGQRSALYKNPPAAVLMHDWIWKKWPEGAVVSPWLLKRLNLIRR